MSTAKALSVAAAAALWGASAVVWSGSSAAATGNGGGPEQGVHGTPLSEGDNQFLHEAYSINAGEVKIGRMAEEKGTTAQVKAFAHRMIGDHSNALEQLNGAAREGHFDVPDNLLPAQTTVFDQLSTLSGKSFDDAYVQHMVTGHAKAIGVFEQEASSGRNDALKQFAAHELPTLRAHEDLAKADAKHLAP